MEKNKKEKGITLVALVVTIIVLLILAGIALSLSIGQSGVVSRAKQAKQEQELVESTQNSQFENTEAIMDEIASGNWGGENPADGDETPSASTLEQLALTDQLVTGANKTVKDKFDNSITVPVGFKVQRKTNEDTLVCEGEVPTIPEGVVIEDKNGNQFVWIPIGTVYKNEAKTEVSTIKLGRYTFNSAGTPTPVQYAFYTTSGASSPTNYLNTVTLTDNYFYYQELSQKRDGVSSSGTDGLNATAKDLAGFMESVKKYGGFYFARHEAVNVDGKPKSIESNYSGIWKSVSQITAALKSRSMYVQSDNVGVESDLISSYAWDTTLVYLQEMGNTNYSNKKSAGIGVIDQACNIRNMANNNWEYTTEYCTCNQNGNASPTVARGAQINNPGRETYTRTFGYSSSEYSTYTFRVMLYVKDN